MRKPKKKSKQTLHTQLLVVNPEGLIILTKSAPLDMNHILVIG